jgi:threonine aldolase
MRAAMADADVGDDVYGEDPTVNRLEKMTAEMLGTEAALFASSGTQTNLMALLSHCERGDEYIVGQQAHTYRYEAGGAAVLGSIQPQPLDFEADGTLNLQAVADAVKPKDSHFARTRLFCLENTQAGKVLPLDYLSKAADLARQHALGLHLDGARVFNAAIKQKVPVSEIADHFDSISICLSKGLGAPVGSMLCGSADFIGKARRWRKMLGGGMRQAGVLAAAAIVALEEHVDRLEVDHENALRLATGLAEVEELAIDPGAVQTNMVFACPDPDSAQDLISYLKGKGVIVGGYGNIRMVTHLDVTAADIDKAVEVIKGYFVAK